MELIISNKTVLIDANDYNVFREYSWHASTCKKSTYVLSNHSKPALRLHRLLMNCPEGMVVDHINGNGLDNRRKNLRICTVAENNRNKKPERLETNTSKYKGVYWRPERKKWIARLWHNNKKIQFGSFVKEIDAALAYNAGAKRVFGEFAWLNPIPQNHPPMRGISRLT